MNKSSKKVNKPYTISGKVVLSLALNHEQKEKDKEREKRRVPI